VVLPIIIKNENQQNKADLKKLFEIRIEQIYLSQKELEEDMSKILSEIKKENQQNKADLNKLIETKIEQIRKENQTAYKDLEHFLRIKLNENKTEIKQLIEHERQQIKYMFEIQLAKNTQELKQSIETESAKQTQQLSANQKTIKISIWAVGVLILAVFAFLLWKL